MGNQTNYHRVGNPGVLGPVGPCEKAFLDDIFYNMYVLFESLDCCLVEDKHSEYKDFTEPGGVIGYKTEVHKTPDVETTESILGYPNYNDLTRVQDQLYILGSRTTTTPGRTEIVSVPQYGPSFVVRRLVTSYYRCSKCNVRKYTHQDESRGAFFNPDMHGIVVSHTEAPPCAYNGTVSRKEACKAAWYNAWQADHPHKRLTPNQVSTFFSVYAGKGYDTESRPKSHPKYSTERALKALMLKNVRASRVLRDLSSQAKNSLPVMLVFAHFHPDLHHLLPAWTRTNATIQRAMQQIV